MIQWALSEKGERVEATGKLDGATTKALVRFQRAKGQPETGYPDFGTLRLLDLKPQEIYVLDRDPKAVERDKATRDIEVVEEAKD